MSTYLTNQKGMTLIEILAGLVLVTLVAGIAVSILLFGVKSYEQTNTQSTLQEHARLGSFDLTKSIRHAEQLGILAEATCPTLAAGYHYICLSLDQKSLKQYVYDATTNTHEVRNMISHMNGGTIELSVDKDATNQKLLVYHLKVEKEGLSYELDSKVTILNAEYISVSGTGAYHTIRYKTP